MKCPHCLEKIKANATVCRYCKETIKHEPELERIWNNTKATFSNLGYYLCAVISLSPWFIPFLDSTHKIIVIVLLQMFFLLLFIRPLKIQSGEALIAFFSFIVSLAATIFLSISTLQEKESFELRNRPYIQINDASLSLKMTGRFRLNNPSKLTFANSYPEPEFLLQIRFLNHGEVPASITNFVVKASKSKKDLITDKNVVIGMAKLDKDERWKNFDVFPYIETSNGLSNIYLHEKYIYLNLDDIRKVFGVQLKREEILKGVQVQSIRDGKWQSSLLSNYKSSDFGEFYLRIELSYFAVGEQNKDRPPYEYWIIYRADGKYAYRFAPIESGIEVGENNVG